MTHKQILNKKTVRLSLFCLFLFYVPSISASSSPEHFYEKYDFDQHLIHVLKIRPKAYHIQLAKTSQEKSESLPMLAKRFKAQIAINGGFFQKSRSGQPFPAGTLIIAGKIYRISNQIQSLLVIESGKINILRANPKQNFKISKKISILSGLPLLLSKSQIPIELKEKTSSFFTQAHARTAIGIKSDQTIVLVVAEDNHFYPLQAFLKQKERVDGLSMIELAEFMKNLGCESALNLDGGSSSALWLKNKIINEATVEKLSDLSDGIIFTKRDLK
ncbi:MAG: phosphodiester glycosidase family protein [Gammaproteobacteria bacterium]